MVQIKRSSNSEKGYLGDLPKELILDLGLQRQKGLEHTKMGKKEHFCNHEQCLEESVGKDSAEK